MVENEAGISFGISSKARLSPLIADSTLEVQIRRWEPERGPFESCPWVLVGSRSQVSGWGVGLLVTESQAAEFQKRRVRHFGLQSADDEVIWDLARRQDFTIVSKDSEFHQRSFIFGFPPKIIWVRLGNCSTRDVAAVLRLHQESIRHFCGDETHTFLVIP